MNPVRIKRVYDDPAEDDGERILVDRIWPRGLSRERAAIDCWMKDIAPSDALRKWYGHDPALFDEFRRRYRAELEANGDSVTALVARCCAATVTLVFAARDMEHSNAAVLREFLEQYRG